MHGRRTWARLHEKGGKPHEMPCHHNLEGYLETYIEGAGIAAEPKVYFFRAAPHKRADRAAHVPGGGLQDDPPARAEDAGVPTRIGCRCFRATVITEYLRNSGKLRWRDRWQIVNPSALRAFMIAATIRSHSMRSSGFGFEAECMAP